LATEILASAVVATWDSNALSVRFSFVENAFLNHWRCRAASAMTTYVLHVKRAIEPLTIHVMTLRTVASERAMGRTVRRSGGAVVLVEEAKTLVKPWTTLFNTAQPTSAKSSARRVLVLSSVVWEAFA
jgi:hypothetical protein